MCTRICAVVYTMYSVQRIAYSTPRCHTESVIKECLPFAAPPIFTLAHAMRRASSFLFAVRGRPTYLSTDCCGLYRSFFSILLLLLLLLALALLFPPILIFLLLSLRFPFWRVFTLAAPSSFSPYFLAKVVRDPGARGAGNLSAVRVPFLIQLSLY